MDLYQYYNKLYNLTLEQKKQVTEANYEQLINILEEKQEVIDEINKHEIKEYLRKQDNPDKTLEELQALMEKIKDLELDSEKEVRKKKIGLKNEIKKFNLQQKGRKGYQGNMKYDAKFIDKKG